MNPGGADPKQEQAGHGNSCGGTRPRAAEEPALGTDNEEEHVLRGLSRESPTHMPLAVKRGAKDTSRHLLGPAGRCQAARTQAVTGTRGL